MTAAQVTATFSEEDHPRSTEGSTAGQFAKKDGKLRSASSVAEAHEYLDSLKLSKPQLAQLARDLHVASYANANKTRLRDDIVAQIVGSRITHDAILRSSGG